MYPQQTMLPQTLRDLRFFCGDQLNFMTAYLFMNCIYICIQLVEIEVCIELNVGSDGALDLTYRIIII